MRFATRRAPVKSDDMGAGEGGTFSDRLRHVLFFSLRALISGASQRLPLPPVVRRRRSASRHRMRDARVLLPPQLSSDRYPLLGSDDKAFVPLGPSQ